MGDGPPEGIDEANEEIVENKDTELDELAHPNVFLCIKDFQKLNQRRDRCLKRR